jgi:hypothetical protein
MLRSRLALFVASAFLLCASRASEVEAQVPGAKFNKDELEAILKKEHSDRVSNIYDSENGIQRRRLSNKCPGTLQPVRPLVAAKGPPTSPRAAPLSLRGHGRAELSGGRPSLAGTRGTWTTRSSVPVWTASAPRKSCRTVRQKDVCGEVRVPVRYGGVGRCLLERVVLYVVYFLAIIRARALAASRTRHAQLHAGSLEYSYLDAAGQCFGSARMLSRQAAPSLHGCLRVRLAAGCARARDGLQRQTLTHSSRAPGNHAPSDPISGAS